MRPRALFMTLAFALVGAPACAPNHGSVYPSAFADAERAETAGRYDEASARYEAAARGAIRDRDRNHATYLSGLMLFRAGKRDEAIAKLTPIANADPPSTHSVDAAYRIAAAHLDHGEVAQGRKEMEALLTRFPNGGVAHPALRRILDLEDHEPGGVRGSIAYLQRLAASPLGATELGELIVFQTAERLADVGDLAAAHDLYLEVATRWPYPGGALWDNSLFRASEADEKLGRFPHAVADLERLLVERETTTLVGSYQRPKMSPALFRIGTLYANQLNDHARARAAFHRLYAEFTTSKLRDDALWLEADLWRQDGDAARACATLATLVSEFSESRYVPCAIDACPALKRPEKSGAPRTCHPYLLRPGRIPE